MQRLERDYVNRVTKVCKPLAIIGYGSFFGGNIHSDFDVFTLVERYNKLLIETIAKSTMDFHRENGIGLDLDIPYENKTLYSRKEVMEVASLSPFPYENGVFTVPKIQMDPIILGGHHMKLRLLLNALTCKNHKVLFGSKEYIKQLTALFSQTLINLALSQGDMKIPDIVRWLVHRDEFEVLESSQLGYKGHDSQTLSTLIQSNIVRMKAEGKVLRHAHGVYSLSPDFLEELRQNQLNIPRSPVNEKLHVVRPPIAKLDFSQNINPLGPPKSIHSMRKSDFLSQIQKYPDFRNTVCNEKLAEFIGVPLENITICSGSLEGIFVLPTLIEPNKHTLLVSPTFWGYASAAERIGSNVEVCKLTQQDFSINLDELRTMLQGKDIVYLCNPNNPTSTYIGKDELLKLIGEFPHCHFILDESILLLQEGFASESISRKIKDHSNVSIVYSLSKFFNIPGLRVGALVSSAENIQKYKDTMVPYSIDSISQALLPVLLEDTAFIQKTRTGLPLLGADLFEKLNKITWLRTHPSSANFFLCQILHPGITATGLCNSLKIQGISIRECTEAYKLEGEWIRISVNLEENNSTLVAALNNYYNTKFGHDPIS